MPRKPSPGLKEKVYQYLVDCAADSVPPTVREIANACGVKSTSTVHAMLNRLEEEGKISRNARFSRGIHIEGMSKTSQVPLVGKVTAGVPILAVEQIEDYIPYPVGTEKSKSVFALRVQGDSMINAGILDGDIIVADQNGDSRVGDIVVGMIDEEATVKRLGREPDGHYYLIPENPNYEPIHAPEIEILGKVIGSFRKY